MKEYSGIISFNEQHITSKLVQEQRKRGIQGPKVS